VQLGSVSGFAPNLSILFAVMHCTSCVVCSLIAYVDDSDQEVGVMCEGISNPLKEGWENTLQHQNIAHNM
jgi:hypothetical protein